MNVDLFSPDQDLLAAASVPDAVVQSGQLPAIAARYGCTISAPGSAQPGMVAPSL